MGKFIFKETICEYLKEKTVILVTHALYYAKNLDYVYLFDKGEVVEEGTFEEVN